MKANPCHITFVKKGLAALAAITVLAALPMQAQTTYTYIGTGDNNTAGSWESTTANWDVTAIPGSLLNPGGDLDDIVILRNNLGPAQDPDTAEVHQIRLASDIGTIGTLEIGGPTVAGYTGNTQLALRAGALVEVDGNVILGTTLFGGQRGGQINYQNGSTTMTVFGNVVSGSAGGGNNINVNQGGASVFELDGDIDSTPARIAAGLAPGVPGTATGGFQQIDLVISRNEGLLLLGTNQVLNLESLYIGHTGANIGTITQSLNSGGATVNAINGRIGSVNNNNRTASATLAVDGDTVNYTNELVVGRGANGNNNDTANATGNLNVGVGSPGIVNVGGELRIAEQLENSATNAQVVTGNVTVDVAGSVLSVAGGVNMGTTFQPGGSTSATITINDGLMSVTGAILDVDSTTAGISTLNLAGGELELLDALGGARDVDLLNFSGGTLDFTVYGGMPTLGTQDTSLASIADGSVIDVTTAPAGSTFSTADFVTWLGGDDEWDADGAKWDGGVIPAEGFGPIAAGDFVVITSTNAITGDPAAAALTAGAISDGWSVTQNTNNITLTTATPIGGGVAVARFDDPAADVTVTDLNIRAEASVFADATQINIDDINSLTVGPGNVILGSSTASGIINQGNIDGTATGGMAVSFLNVTSLGAAAGTVYNLNEGTLSVNTMAISPGSDAELIINSSTANSFTATGSVTVDHIRVGRDPGSNVSITVDYPLVTGAMDIAEDGDAQGAVTIASGGSITTSRRLYVAGDQTGNQDQATVGSLTLETGGTLTVSGGNLEIGRDGMGSFTISGGTYNQNTNNLVLGQNNGGDLADTMAFGILDVDGGILNIGIFGDTTANNNLNINAGGGTITQTGGDVIVDWDLVLVDRGPNGGDYTITGGNLTIGRNLNYRGANLDATNDSQTGSDTVTIGGTAAVTVGNNVVASTPRGNHFLVVNGGSLEVDNILDVGNSIIQTGGIVTVGNAATTVGNSVRLTVQGDQDSTYAISGGSLDIVGDLLYRGGTGNDLFAVSGDADVTVGGNIGMGTSSSNTLSIDGPLCSLTVGGDLFAGGGAARVLQFNYDGGVSPIVVGGIADLSGANMNIVVGGTFTDTTAGDFELIEVAGDISNTLSNFSGLVDGQPLVIFGDGSGYVLSVGEVESGNDGNDVWALATASVPPSDTDGDGMDDIYEITNFGDLTRDGTEDFDVDGTSDLDEFLFGTDPTDPNSVFTIEVTLVDPGGNMVDVTYGPLVDGLRYELDGDTTGFGPGNLLEDYTAGPADDGMDRTFTDTYNDPSKVYSVEVFGNEITP